MTLWGLIREVESERAVSAGIESFVEWEMLSKARYGEGAGGVERIWDRG